MAMVEIGEIGRFPEPAEAEAAWVHGERWTGSSTTPAEIAGWVRSCTVAGSLPNAGVAVSGERPVGSVFLHRSEAEDGPADTPYLGALHVGPASRGRGIGRGLAQTASRHAAGLGFPGFT